MFNDSTAVHTCLTSLPTLLPQICTSAEARVRDTLSRVQWLARALLLSKKAEIEATAKLGGNPKNPKDAGDPRAQEVIQS